METRSSQLSWTTYQTPVPARIAWDYAPGMARIIFEAPCNIVDMTPADVARLGYVRPKPTGLVADPACEGCGEPIDGFSYECDADSGEPFGHIGQGIVDNGKCWHLDCAETEPEQEQVTCPQCAGEGHVKTWGRRNPVTCGDCDGGGTVTVYRS